MKRGQTIQEKEKRQLLAELVWFERGGERISLPELMEEAGVQSKHLWPVARGW